MTEISREFRFEAAHRLLGHPGKCAHLHGHSYRVVVTVSAANLHPRGPSRGMVMDFGDLNSTVAGILDRWDHTTILEDGDPLIGTLVGAGQSVTTISGPPTAEIMTHQLGQEINQRLPPQVRVVRLTLWETPKAYATWTGDQA